MVVEAFKSVPSEDWEILRKRSLNQKAEVRSLQAIVASLVYADRQMEMVH